MFHWSVLHALVPQYFNYFGTIMFFNMILLIKNCLGKFLLNFLENFRINLLTLWWYLLNLTGNWILLFFIQIQVCLYISLFSFVSELQIFLHTDCVISSIFYCVFYFSYCFCRWLGSCLILNFLIIYLYTWMLLIFTMLACTQTNNWINYLII